MNDNQQRVLDILRERGLLRPRDLASHVIPRITLTRMVAQGVLQQVSRGLYALANRPTSAHASLVEVACKYPQGVVCLLSALRVHDLTTHAPFEVWLAIPNKARAPKLEYPPLRIVRYTDLLLREGVEDRQIDGISIRVTDVARTVADCFKFRNKIGLDVALEALTEAWRAKRVGMDALWRAATACRVGNVMRPYLESLSYQNVWGRSSNQSVQKPHGIGDGRRVARGRKIMPRIEGLNP